MIPLASDIRLELRPLGVRSSHLPQPGGHDNLPDGMHLGLLHTGVLQFGKKRDAQRGASMSGSQPVESEVLVE